MHNYQYYNYLKNRMKLFLIICVFNANAFIVSKIDVSNLDTLIFYKNKYTKHGGENPIPQLNYIEHKALI